MSTRYRRRSSSETNAEAINNGKISQHVIQPGVNLEPNYNQTKLPEHFTYKEYDYIYYCRVAFINIIAIAYFAFATYVWINQRTSNDLNWCNGYGLLLLIYCYAYGKLLYSHIKKYILNPLCKVCSACLHSFGYKHNSKREEIIVCVILAVSIMTFIIIDTYNSMYRLVGFIGIFLIMAIGWVLSKYPTKVSWKAIVWGLIVQFVLAMISIRWPLGRSVFECISDKIVVFLNFSKEGARFVFSNELVDNGVFAFTVLPVIIFFSFVIQILYHLGVMQYLIKKIGWVLSLILGTTACESLHAATTLFLGLPESFLVIEPYLNKLTTSEIHAIMCSCFSTISGTVLAAYISFGAPPVHLITAMVLSAPAGLCYAKLLFPETEKSSTHFKTIALKKARETSFLYAATEGALSAIPLVLGIVANVVAFVSAVAFVNSILGWLGSLIGYSDLTFELILAKVFTPISYIIGVPWEECETVGTLIGLKTVINELIAYQRFGEFKEAGKLSPRAAAIATYAICGFSNPGALGVLVGSLSTMAHEKKDVISKTVMRAFIGGIAVCFLTASIAGILLEEESHFKNTLLSNGNKTFIL